MIRLLRRSAVGLLVLAVLATGVGWKIHSSLLQPYRGYSEETRFVNVDAGLGAPPILERLEAAGVIRSAFWTRLYLGRYLDDPTLKAGEYEFSVPMPATAVIEKLVRGEVVTHPVTLVEGLDLFEVAAHLAASGFGDETEFLRQVQSPGRIAAVDPEATDLEGYLFPDTYSFARGTSEAEIVSTLVDTFLTRLRDEIAPLLPAEGGRTLRELVTLASIVEKETSLDEERPIVAAVYSNRLDREMGLYADPTVIYGLKRSGTWDGNLKRRDLEADTPYNTYRVPGLPPGPICSPGVASLQAAARPADVAYLYFVSRNDGSHAFARSLSEHNRNVEIWQKRYWRDRRARERAERQRPG